MRADTRVQHRPLRRVRVVRLHEVHKVLVVRDAPDDVEHDATVEGVSGEVLVSSGKVSTHIPRKSVYQRSACLSRWVVGEAVQRWARRQRRGRIRVMRRHVGMPGRSSQIKRTVGGSVSGRSLA